MAGMKDNIPRSCLRIVFSTMRIAMHLRSFPCMRWTAVF
jgi:hypothetical protein